MSKDVKKTGENKKRGRNSLPPGPGRPKGLPNKLTASAKQAFELAFQGLGGVPQFVEWAKDNQTDFYKLYSKLIPVNMTGSVGLNIQIVDYSNLPETPDADTE